MSKLYTCNCCGYFTLDSKGEYEICPICKWEDEDMVNDFITDSLNSYSCNNLSLFEYQERYFNFQSNSSENKIINEYEKDPNFMTVKEKVYNQISSEKNYLTTFFKHLRPQTSHEETYQVNLFKIVLEYLKDFSISEYNKKIIEIFNQNVFPTLNLSILSCLINFKTQMTEDFLVSYLIDSENVDSKENDIINSYWKDDKS